MRYPLITLGRTLMLACLATAAARAGEEPATPPEAADPLQRILHPDPLVWAGVDYSRCLMIGKRDFPETRVLFPDLLHRWNIRFAKRGLPALGKAVKGPIVLDMRGVSRRNGDVGPDHIVEAKNDLEADVHRSHLDPDALAALVRGYELDRKEGVGFVIVVDRLVAPHGMACFFSVFFDVAERSVLKAERQCYPAYGNGLRDFWYHPLQAAMDDMEMTVWDWRRRADGRETSEP